MINNSYVIFITPDGSEYKIKIKTGENLYEVAKRENIPIKGNCGGEMACNTCHVSIEESFFEKIEILNEVIDEEIDLLETSSNYVYNSRLCCQIKYEDSMNGMKIIIKPGSYGYCDH